MRKDHNIYKFFYNSKGEKVKIDVTNVPDSAYTDIFLRNIQHGADMENSIRGYLTNADNLINLSKQHHGNEKKNIMVSLKTYQDTMPIVENELMRSDIKDNNLKLHLVMTKIGINEVIFENSKPMCNVL